MTWSWATYDEIKQEIKAGDVIAFGGDGGFAGVIKWATLGTDNHVAVVLGSDRPLEGQAGTGSSHAQTQSIRIIESTSLLAVGAATLLSLFLLEPGQWPVVVIAVGVALPLAIIGLLLPVRGAHRRIRNAKEAELEWTRERIRRASSFVYKLSAPESPGQLGDLYAYQQLIKDVPEWPIEGSALVRVTLYLTIPIVSWFCSLLIENLLGFVFR